MIRPRTSLTAGATILSVEQVSLSIFHLHGAKARYVLEQPQPPLGQLQSPYFAADPDNGKITLARALPVGDYTLTLRLIYEGLTATRVRLCPFRAFGAGVCGGGIRGRSITNEIYFPTATGADSEVLLVTVTGDDVTVFVDSQSLPIRARPVREEGGENGDELTVVYRVEFEADLTSIITVDKQKVSLILRAQGALTESTEPPTVAFATVEILSGPLGFGRDDTLIIPVSRSGVALPAGEAGITIWHIAFPGRTTHTIDQSDDNLLFTVDAASGQIAIVDVLENRSEHDLTLRMIGYGYDGVGPAESFGEAEAAITACNSFAAVADYRAAASNGFPFGRDAHNHGGGDGAAGRRNRRFAFGSRSRFRVFGSACGGGFSNRRRRDGAHSFGRKGRFGIVHDGRNGVDGGLSSVFSACSSR